VACDERGSDDTTCAGNRRRRAEAYLVSHGIDCEPQLRPQSWARRSRCGRPRGRREVAEPCATSSRIIRVATICGVRRNALVPDSGASCRLRAEGTSGKVELQVQALQADVARVMWHGRRKRDTILAAVRPAASRPWPRSKIPRANARRPAQPSVVGAAAARPPDAGLTGQSHSRSPRLRSRIRIAPAQTNSDAAMPATGGAPVVRPESAGPVPDQMYDSLVTAISAGAVSREGAARVREFLRFSQLMSGARPLFYIGEASSRRTPDPRRRCTINSCEPIPNRRALRRPFTSWLLAGQRRRQGHGADCLFPGDRRSIRRSPRPISAAKSATLRP